MISKQSVADQFLLRVEVIEDNVGVAFVAGREDNDFTDSGELLQELNCEGSDVHSGVDFLAGGEANAQRDIVRNVKGFITMNQSFVQI